MRLLVDKMPKRPVDCFFARNYYDRDSPSWFICNLTHRLCEVDSVGCNCLSCVEKMVNTQSKDELNERNC